MTTEEIQSVQLQDVLGFMRLVLAETRSENGKILPCDIEFFLKYNQDAMLKCYTDWLHELYCHISDIQTLSLRYL